MPTVTPDRSRVAEAFAAESTRVVELVRSCRDMSTPVPGLDWNVGQLAAHITSVYERFARTVRGDAADGEIDRGFIQAMQAVDQHQPLPGLIAAANRYLVGHMDALDSPAAADALSEQAAGLTEAVHAASDLSAHRPTPWYGIDSTRTIGTLACLAVTESLVHGRDLAVALGAQTRMSRRSAAAATPTVMSAMYPGLVDARKAGSLRAGFEVRMPGADPFVLRLEQGRLECVEPGERGVDCVVYMDPCAALLIAFGRQSLVRAVLTGGAIATGRKPWLGLRFPSLFVVP